MTVASAPFGNTAGAGPQLRSFAFTGIFISSAKDALALNNNRANGINLHDILASYVERGTPVWAGHYRSQRTLPGLISVAPSCRKRDRHHFWPLEA
jgi:hypothetical protein